MRSSKALTICDTIKFIDVTDPNSILVVGKYRVGDLFKRPLKRRFYDFLGIHDLFDACAAQERC